MARTPKLIDRLLCLDLSATSDLDSVSCAVKSIRLKPSIVEKLESSSRFRDYLCTHRKSWI